VHRNHTLRMLAVVAITLVAGLAPAAGAPAERCFDATGYCMSGTIKRFWEENGGLAVFGYPLTPLQTETIEGRAAQVQWFERHRLELHPERPWPATVELGRLGADLLARQDRDLAAAPAAPAAAGCRTFAETGRSVCGPVLAAWRAAGIELDGRRGKSFAESLALYGLPLTDLQPETLADGRTTQVQWFERARFELHPELPGSPVLNGLLGAELGPRPAAPALNPAEPVWISIPAIKLDGPVVASGLDSSSVPVVPKHEVGWYNQSAVPGAGENVVLWGHVLRFTEAPRIPAPFAGLKELPVGSEIALTTRSGDSFTYVVAEKVWARPDQVQYILPRGRELLTLVSCIGQQVIEDGEVTDMSHRLITIAVPAR
jgi:hypothetical protein